MTHGTLLARGATGTRRRGPTTTNHPSDEEHSNVADKSPRQHQSKKSGKSLKEKRTEKKGKQATKRLGS